MKGESFVSILKTELVYRHHFSTREVTRVAIFEYTEGFYRRGSGLSSLGYESPADYETATMEEIAVV